MPEWVGQIGGYIGLVVFIGAVVVYLRGSRDKGTITTLQQNNDALLERVALLEGESQRLKDDATAKAKIHDAEVKALDLRIDALEKENQRLQALRPSAEVLTELNSTTTALCTQLEQHDVDIKALLDGKTPTRKGSP